VCCQYARSATATQWPCAGESLDRAGMSRVASVTAEAFLDEVAAHLANFATVQPFDVVRDAHPLPEGQGRTTR